MITEDFKQLVTPRELERIKKVAENEARKKKLQNPKFFEAMPPDQAYIVGLMESLIVTRARMQ